MFSVLFSKISNILLLFTLYFSSASFSQISLPNEHENELNQIYKKLKNSHIDFRAQGTICEQVARLDFEKEYPPPHYQVETGITYADESDRVLGELDLVVIDADQQRAIAIAEVKCWKNLKRAKRKAQKQLERLQSVLDQHQNVHFFKTFSTYWAKKTSDGSPPRKKARNNDETRNFYETRSYNNTGNYHRKRYVDYTDLFDGSAEFLTISQKSDQETGFSRTLDFSLSELMELRERLMRERLMLEEDPASAYPDVSENFSNTTWSVFLSADPIGTPLPFSFN
jgi:hypothetical protein